MLDQFQQLRAVRFVKTGANNHPTGTRQKKQMIRKFDKPKRHF